MHNQSMEIYKELDSNTLKIIKDFYNLKEHEIKALKVISNNPYNIIDLSKKLRKERSTLQKTLSKLTKLGFFDKCSKCCDQSGGRYFVYSIKSRTKIVSKIKQDIVKKNQYYNSLLEI